MGKATFSRAVTSQLVSSLGLSACRSAAANSYSSVSKTGGYSHRSSRYSALTDDRIYFDPDAIFPIPILETIAEETPSNPEFLAWKSAGAELGLQRDFRIKLTKENGRETLTFLFYESNWPKDTMEPHHKEFWERNWN